MSQWQSFVHSDAFPPEIRLGLYEVWLSGIGFGPTQAERVLIHSPMLEHAFERRFVTAEMGLDFSGFEAEHSSRIDYALSTLHSHFAKHQTSELFDLTARPNQDLIGLAIPTKDITCLPEPDQVSVSNEVEMIEHGATADKCISSQIMEQSPLLPLSATDSDPYAYSDEEKDLLISFVEAVEIARLVSRRPGVRTKRDIKMRKQTMPRTHPKRNTTKQPVYERASSEDSLHIFPGAVT